MGIIHSDQALGQETRQIINGVLDGRSSLVRNNVYGYIHRETLRASLCSYP